MPMQIKGELNQIGEELFSIRQAAGILDFEQSRLYKALSHLPLPKLRLMGTGKPVLALPSSLILTMLDCTDTKEFKRGSSEKRIVLLRECAEKAIESMNQNPESSAGIIKEIAARFFKKIK